MRIKRNKLGLQAGELVHVGSHSTEPVTVSLISYNEANLDEVPQFDYNAPVSEDRVNWIQVSGVHATDVIRAIGTKFDLHPLVLEDIMTTHQRPKVDEYPNYFFIVLRFLRFNEETNKIDDEQLSFVLDKNFLITFQERSSTLFDSLKERLRQSKGMIRKYGADFLTYAMIDTVVDHYFVLLDNVGAKLEKLEEELEGMTTHKGLSSIHNLRREIVFLRKSLLPTREVINRLIREDSSKFFTEITRFYLKDVFDHSIQIMDSVDTIRDLSRGLLDVNLSNMSYRMNEVIKILTVVSTTFVPLTFITSFYGMNFEFMPELHWKYGYFGVIVILLLIALFMIRFFKKRKWF